MNLENKKYDILIVGGGHAGIEAACVCAKRGLTVGLITLKIDEIGKMSCNPAIGGLAKGHLVKEIDAFDGLMGLAIDDVAIQYRLLNTRKGSAVRSTRAQADRFDYVTWMVNYLKKIKNIELIEANASELINEGKKVYGVRLKDGRKILGKKIILTTGTFLNGLMHIGDEKYTGGRWASNEKVTISNSMISLGIKMGRLKTGTPARLNTNTINYDELEIQNGDKDIKPFSFMNNNIIDAQIPCYITYTNDKTHRVIKENLKRSPLYTGKIKGIGPRYCPSIEDKIVRFHDKNRHQIFLEPEGRNTLYVYPNGISTSLPKDVQEDFIKTIKGLENVEIMKYGYAVEYDYVFPTQLDHTLKVKSLQNLYLAGQINGTSGYEEAAAQGLIAGINASNEILKKDHFVLRRYESYIGVLIDDLVTKGTSEPYRMFTSRAEHRLLLREDNADLRLTEKALNLGIVSEERKNLFFIKKEINSKIKSFLKTSKISPKAHNQDFIRMNSLSPLNKTINFWQYIKKGSLEIEGFLKLLEIMKLENKWEAFQKGVSKDLLNSVWNTVQTDILLEGYISRENDKIGYIKKQENLKIPENFKFDEVYGITREAKEKLIENNPKNIHEASKISGLTPAAIEVLLINIKKFKNAGTNQ